MKLRFVFVAAIVGVMSISCSLTLEEVKSDPIMQELERSYGGAINDIFLEAHLSSSDMTLLDMQDYYLEKVIRQKAVGLMEEVDYDCDAFVSTYKKELLLGELFLTQLRLHAKTQETVANLKGISRFLVDEQPELDALGHGEDEGEKCPVCLDSMRFGDDELKFTQLACGHFLHEACFAGWFKSGAHESNKCPLCKKDLRGKLTEYQRRAVCPPPPLPPGPPEHLLYGMRESSGDMRPRRVGQLPQFLRSNRVSDVSVHEDPDLAVNYDEESQLSLMESVQNMHRFMRVQAEPSVRRRRRWSILRTLSDRFVVP